MPVDREELIKSRSVSEFLSWVVAHHKGQPLSYSELGRMCGIKSRSHPRDIVLGKKKVSLETARQITRGLKLTSELRDFFLLLAERELARDPDARQLLEHDLEKSRAQVLERSRKKKRNPEDFFSLSEASLVYAALGSAEQGTDVPSIMAKTLLKEPRVDEILKALTAKGFVASKSQRFFATDRHLEFSAIKSGESFENFYLTRLRQAAKRASTKFDSESELFWEATLSVKLKDVARLKEELRQVLARFAEGAEEPSGEALRSLTVGFIDPRT